MDLAGRTRRTLARLAVAGLLLTAGMVARIGRALRGQRAGGAIPRRSDGKVSLLVVGTFYNPNWIRSHLFPLARAANVADVRVVCSQAALAHPKLIYDVPPRWLSRLAGRAVSKVVWFFVVACRRRPHVAIGYHIMPNGLLALMASGLVGCRSIYQMTGGPVQFIGGGCGSENPLLHMQGGPSRTLENWMLGVGRLMDRIVVRGETARRFLRDHRVCDAAPIVTGSVDVDRFCPRPLPKRYDIAYVARLVPAKGLEPFLDIVAELKKRRAEIRAVVAGDGVLRESLIRRARELGVEENVAFLGQTDDVPGVLAQARLFMLVSPTEGLAIAMLEAMSAGLPVVVNDVGDLRDAIADGRSGILLSDRRPDCAAEVVLSLLEDAGRLEAMGAAARQTAVEHYSLGAVANRWAALLDGAGPSSVRTAGNHSGMLDAAATGRQGIAG